jgi:hypothetical protein
MNRTLLSRPLDLAAVRVTLLKLSDTADTPAVGRLLLQAYELTLVAEQYIDPMKAPIAPGWYAVADPIAGGVLA